MGKLQKAVGKFTHQLSLINRQSTGFTLIELLIVFSIMAILSGIGVAAFINFSRSQSLDTTMSDMKTTLITARSRALSQLKVGTCATNSLQLQGYEVIFCCSNPGCISCYPDGSSTIPSYEMNIVCANADGSGVVHTPVYSKKFTDPNISYSSSPTTTANSYFFEAVNAAVTTNASDGTTPQIGITSFDITKTVSVSTTGVIQ